MTVVLLLGAGGQLGQEIVARAPAARVTVVARTRRDTDIADRDAVATAVRAAKPSMVINTAAYTKVDKAESEQDEAHRTNVTGAGIIAEACAAADVPLIHLSTDYVFDGAKPSPYVETDPTNPLGVYGATKLAGEQAIRARHDKHLIVRTSWVYGIYGANFLKTILRLADQRDELRIVADQYGSPTSTRDLADILLQLAPRLRDGAPWGTYHLTGEGAATWHGFAAEILKARETRTGKATRLTPIATADYPTAARRPANSVLDNALFRATFGLKARPWREAARETVDGLLGH
jgi:dTDP-4-dehydrorhamnose reductase